MRGPGPARKSFSRSISPDTPRHERKARMGRSDPFGRTRVRQPSVDAAGVASWRSEDEHAPDFNESFSDAVGSIG